MTTITINNFSSKNKEIILKKCMELKDNYDLLIDLEINYSCERGFELPLTKDWVNILSSKPNYDLLKYHNMRQLRFIERNDMVVGLRCKDDIPYWTIKEFEQLKELINTVISQPIFPQLFHQ